MPVSKQLGGGCLCCHRCSRNIHIWPYTVFINYCLFLLGKAGPVRDEAGSGDFGLGQEALQGHRKAIKGGAEKE